MKFTLVAAVALAATVATASPAVAHDKSKEYRLADGAVPADIAVGPDRALYAADGSLGRLWRVGAHGRASSIELGGGPAGVATGPDGALWVTDRTNSRIQRVTTRGRVTNHPLPTPDAFPTDIVAGPDGALWFTETRADKIGRITTDGAITEYPLATQGAFAADIAVGPDGALWFTEQSGNKVGRVTTSGELTEYELPNPDSLPGPIVAGHDGALWVAEVNHNAITRITTSGEVSSRYTIPAAHATPLGLAATERGLLISQHAIGTIGQMSYSGAFGRDIRLRSNPDRITLGPDGALWYASSNEGRVGRVPLDR